MENKIKFIFWGTPGLAADTLEILKNNGYIPSLVITSPDKPKGRKMIVTPPPVKNWAIENKIPFWQPNSLNNDFYQQLKSIKHDLSIVVAYGKIIPEIILHLPKLGFINIHYSLLPKYRGASPVESAILNGETETGVTIQQMQYELDSGPILATDKIKINANEKTPELRSRLTKIGAELLVKTIPNLVEGKIKQIKQNTAEATFCKKIQKKYGQIDLNDDPVKNYNKFRAYIEWPRIFFFKDNKRIIITEAKIEDKKFVIEKVLPEGKKEINYQEFLKTNTSNT